MGDQYRSAEGSILNSPEDTARYKAKAQALQKAEDEARAALSKEGLEAYKADLDLAKSDLREKEAARKEADRAAVAASEAARQASAKLQAQYDALQAKAAGDRKVEKIDLADERYKQSLARLKAEQEQLDEEDKKRRKLLGEPDPTPYTPPKNVAPYTPESSNFVQTLITLFNRAGSTQTPTTTYAPKGIQSQFDKTNADVGRELDKFFQPIDTQSSTLDTAPIVEAVQKVTQAISDKSAADNEAIATAASAISETAGQVPPPVDLSPVVAAQGEYHAAVMAAFANTQSQLAALESKVANQASQLRQLAARV